MVPRTTRDVHASLPRRVWGRADRPCPTVIFLVWIFALLAASLANDWRNNFVLLAPSCVSSAASKVNVRVFEETPAKGEDEPVEIARAVPLPFPRILVPRPPPSPPTYPTPPASPDLYGFARCKMPPCSRDKNCSSPKASTICCHSVLQEILDATEAYLEELNVPHYVFFGTLLGGVRSRSIIDYTSDIDIAVEPDDFAKIENISQWNPRFYAWHENDEVGRLCIVDEKSPRTQHWGESWSTVPVYLDIYVARHFNDTGGLKTMFKASPKCIFNTTDIYGADGGGFGEVSIGGTLVPAPAHPEKILLKIYGSTWTTPSGSGGHGGDHYCID